MTTGEAVWGGEEACATGDKGVAGEGERMAGWGDPASRRAWRLERAAGSLLAGEWERVIAGSERRVIGEGREAIDRGDAAGAGEE